MAKMSRAERRERLKQRQNQDMKTRESSDSNFRPIFDTKDFDDVHFFKPKKGKNEIDILPFLVTDPNKMPYGNGLAYEEEDEAYVLEIYYHGGVGPAEDKVLCLNKTYKKACPICEAQKELKDNGKAWDDDEVKALNPKRRVVYNIIDLNDEEKGIQIFDASFHLFQKELYAKAEYLNEGFETFSDLEDGATIEFRGAAEKFGKHEWIKPKDFGFSARDPYEESIFDDVYPLDTMLIIPTYEEVQNLFLGLDVDEGEEKEDEKPKTSKTRKKKAVKEEPKEQKEEKTSRRSRRVKKEEEPEPEDDEDQDEPSGICPYGFIFGVDWDGQEACQECEDDCYNSCEEQFNIIKKADEEPEPEPKEEEPKTKRRARKRR